MGRFTGTPDEALTTEDAEGAEETAAVTEPEDIGWILVFVETEEVFPNFEPITA